jgi:hypothetical protein
MILRSGLCGGQAGSRVGMRLSLFHWVVRTETWHGALSSCSVQRSVGKCLVTTGHKHSSSTFIYSSEFIFPSTGYKFSNTFVSNTAPKQHSHRRLTILVTILLCTLRHNSFMWATPHIYFLVFSNNNLRFIWKIDFWPMFPYIPVIFWSAKRSPLTSVDTSNSNRLRNSSPFESGIVFKRLWTVLCESL